MDILSYRGPCSPGGVSGTISRALKIHGNSDERWWYLSEAALMVRSGDEAAVYAARIPDRLVMGHYRYCNNFLWPIMHDLAQYASFSGKDRTCYQQLNLAIAANVLYREEACAPKSYFVQDYQVAGAAAILSSQSKAQTTVFWHIPWPKSVPPQYISQIAEIAGALLGASRVGFHIEEYVRNFLLFVKSHMPDYVVDLEKCTVAVQRGSSRANSIVEIVPQPLGLDIDFWKQQSVQCCGEFQDRLLRQLVPGRYVLSVDRADYTKGLRERLKAIDVFFEKNPQWRKQITFLQLCQRTREGLEAFDKYWEECNLLAQQVNSRWGNRLWKPIVWVPDPVSPAVLATLYHKASIMLVNPLRDGLNLTAKEFVACAGDISGVLLISENAGASQELGKYPVPVLPGDPERLAEAILEGLHMPLSERRHNLLEMRKTLQKNTLSAWWQTFAGNEPVIELHEQVSDQPLRKPKKRVALEALTAVGS